MNAHNPRDRRERPRYKTRDDKTTCTVEGRWTRWENGSKMIGRRDRGKSVIIKPPLLISNPIYRSRFTGLHQSPSVYRLASFPNILLCPRAPYCFRSVHTLSYSWRGLSVLFSFCLSVPLFFFSRWRTEETNQGATCVASEAITDRGG